MDFNRILEKQKLYEDGNGRTSRLIMNYQPITANTVYVTSITTLINFKSIRLIGLVLFIYIL